ncbi:thiosulfate/3-mercaptopyruvate sulfurtransferase [Flavobacterium succinicans]|uniref:Thiosulfate/3-mercaptopyruvate sulfurtransferase n=1 Tax=Flavobacterium succinicans TaxID=29536 RepID=A0A1I4XCN9_9FLAO|nr:sulfurtransferase [Flavobacterium succinicans]SFN23273.1 thiosulfate/3-mercaptopyruvate sulfurtransferase [Flavobacterium succinicans]
MSVSTIINATELLTIYKTENILLVDASNGPNTKLNYENKHLEGALFVDANTQLATIETDVAVGGRHPLPSLEDFSKTLGDLGITPQTWVVIYDDKNGANAAARFWWMLRAVGHEKAQVLNGGIQAAEKIGFPVNSEPVHVVKKEKYPCTTWQWPLASMEEVENVAELPSHTVIDVREAFRYNGESEPIDLIAGHIPGAINFPFTQNLDENGLFLPKEVLQEKYTAILSDTKSENTIIHCGSGITACHTLLAILQAGFAMPKLYVGSWSEWSRNHKPIAPHQK